MSGVWLWCGCGFVVEVGGDWHRGKGAGGGRSLRARLVSGGVGGPAIRSIQCETQTLVTELHDMYMHSRTG